MDQPTAASVSHTLTDLGWDPGWATAFLPFDAAGWLPARVVAAHRDSWVVAVPGGDRAAVIAGRLRHEAVGAGDLPAVGDWVAVAGLDAGTTAVIQAVLPRRTAFGRNTSADGYAGNLAGEQVLAANVDVALVDRRASTATSTCGASSATSRSRGPAGRRPSSCSTRPTSPSIPTACASPPRPSRPASRSGSSRRSPATASASSPTEHLRPGRTAVVLGSSGVGKSTLVNALLGHERQRTGAVRDDDSRGRHTTTHRELVRLPGGALLIDTPGIRSLGVAGATDGLETTFADIAELADAAASGTAATRASPAATCGRRSTTAGSIRPASRAIASSSARRRTSPAPRTRSPGRRSAVAGSPSRPRWPSTCGTSTGATNDHDADPPAGRPGGHEHHVPAVRRPRRRRGDGPGQRPPPRPGRDPRPDRPRRHAPSLHPPRELGSAGRLPPRPT